MCTMIHSKHRSHHFCSKHYSIKPLMYRKRQKVSSTAGDHAVWEETNVSTKPEKEKTSASSSQSFLVCLLVVIKL